MAVRRIPLTRTIKTGLPAPVRQGLAKARSIDIPSNDASAPYMELVGKGDQSKQITDPFVGLYGGNDGDFIAIAPFYPPHLLVRAAKQNSTLNQCIDAYVVNIESYGYQLEYTGPQGAETSAKAQAEKNIAKAFLDCPNGDTSLRQIREESRKDLEYTGMRYFEIGQDLIGRPVWMTNVPAVTVRLTRKDRTPTPYDVLVPDPSGVGYIKRTVSKYFRRYIQIGTRGERVFFKEFGDPRPIDPKTGKVDASLPIEDQATAIYAQALYMPGSEYGVPRWIGVLPSILGTRESELVNLNFFRENAIPAMAVMISGGALTEESYDKVTNLLTASRGKDAMNRILILEAAADDSTATTDQAPPAPKIDMKPMVSERQQDGLFEKYEVQGKRKIRSSMRLPAIYAGDSEEYTKATAQTGQRIAESQVFYPERSFFDEFVQRRIFPLLGVSQWRFKTMGPTIYDPKDLSDMLDKFAGNGAMTPNILIKIANQILDVQLHPVTAKWGDIPFDYTMGLINAGLVVEDFEDIFSAISDLTGIPGVNDPGGPAAPDSANDNPVDIQASVRKAAARGRTKDNVVMAQLRSELHKLSNKIIADVNEAFQRNADAAADNIIVKEAS